MAKATILIVEDEGIVAQEIKSRLERSGYGVCAIVHDGEAAIEKSESMRPDLVLMDIRLNGPMDGIEAAGRIRERFHIPVVYLTAYADSATLERAGTREPFGYVVKPFETRNLVVSIEMALNRHKSESDRIDREKLQAVLETAGAICHELNQPMMAISGQSELLLYTMDRTDPAYEKIEKIQAQVRRMSQITQKLMGITRYETKNYTEGDRIIDIERSSVTLG